MDRPRRGGAHKRVLRRVPIVRFMVHIVIEDEAIVLVAVLFRTAVQTGRGGWVML